MEATKPWINAFRAKSKQVTLLWLESFREACCLHRVLILCHRSRTEPQSALPSSASASLQLQFFFVLIIPLLLAVSSVRSSTGDIARTEVYP
ncbi:hypothetical protein FF1_025752 [Malus domestica]